MKLLQKPILPLFILILIASAFVYRDFIKDYNDTEKQILKYSYEQNQGIKQEFLRRVEQNKRRLEDEIEGRMITICLNEEFDGKIKQLNEVYAQTVKNYFVSKDKILEFNKNSDYKYLNKIPKLKELQLQTAFQYYIKEVSKVDSTIAQTYQDFVFEKGRSDQEIYDFYFDTDKYLQAFHYSRFEIELAQMYYDDVKVLVDKFSLAPFNLDIKDAKVVPFIIPTIKDEKFTDEYSIETITCFPFDRQNTKVVYPKGMETVFDENGFIVIPKEYRKDSLARFEVQFPIDCGRDTTLGIVIDFKTYNEYFNDEK
ncbi:hypothetical protein [Bernardetia sp.]|uniref:hypothetical protein n=1 Tax=Bernardetia sp. TaxID=1937974 RepID=UPI0025BF5957|nr:hypothetical protein [Bernardetia sp.]